MLIFLPQVEIERTSTSQAVPRSKHANQRPIHHSSLPELVPSNGQPISNIKPDRDAGLQPSDVSVMNSGKRKRENESESKPQVGVLKSAVTGLATAIPAGHEGHQKSSADEQEERDLKKARRKEKKEKKDRSQHTQDIANIVAPKSEDRQKGLEVQDEKVTKNKEKKGKKKNKESSPAVMDGNVGQTGSHIDVKEDELSKESQSKAQVDDDTKGGVESIDDDALKPPEQSADQIQQQRRRSGITTDNDWLRAKTSRILDLVDEAPLNARSAGAGPEERKAESAANQDVERSDLPDLSTNLDPPATHGSLSSSGRLFVRNLPYSATESDIESLFSKYGRLEEVRLEYFSPPVFMMIA